MVNARIGEPNRSFHRLSVVAIPIPLFDHTTPTVPHQLHLVKIILDWQTFVRLQLGETHMGEGIEAARVGPSGKSSPCSLPNGLAKLAGWKKRRGCSRTCSPDSRR